MEEEMFTEEFLLDDPEEGVDDVDEEEAEEAETDPATDEEEI